MDNRVLFGIMCIIFNGYGVPCFMQGKKEIGIKRILINTIKGIIMGIEILKMTDEEYEAKKGTFDSGIPA